MYIFYDKLNAIDLKKKKSYIISNIEIQHLLKCDQKNF